MLSDEMPGPCTLDSVQLLCGSDVYNHGVFLNAGVYACHTTAAELDSACEANYAGNKPVQLTARDTLNLSWESGAWEGFGFDSPFGYNGSDNLVLEFRWLGDDGGSVYNLGYYTAGNRAVDAKSPTAEYGTPRNYMPRFRIFYTSDGIAEGTRTARLPGIAAKANPFRSSMTLRVPGACGCDAAIYSATGRLVRRIAGAGPEFCWDGNDRSGRHVPPGAYFCRVSGGVRVRLVCGK